MFSSTTSMTMSRRMPEPSTSMQVGLLGHIDPIDHQGGFALVLVEITLLHVDPALPALDHFEVLIFGDARSDLVIGNRWIGTVETYSR